MADGRPGSEESVMRVLVTGADGFIGSHLTEYLLGKESEQQNANKNRPKSNEIGCQTIGMEPNTKPSPKPVSTKHNLGTQTIRHATLAGTCQTDPLPVRIAPSTDSEELEE